MMIFFCHCIKYLGNIKKIWLWANLLKLLCKFYISKEKYIYCDYTIIILDFYFLDGIINKLFEFLTELQTGFGKCSIVPNFIYLGIPIICF